jgi:hypothetical protein
MEDRIIEVSKAVSSNKGKSSILLRAEKIPRVSIVDQIQPLTPEASLLQWDPFQIRPKHEYQLNSVPVERIVLMVHQRLKLVAKNILDEQV